MNNNKNNENINSVETTANIIGMFHAFTWDGQVYTFYVYDNNTMSFPRYNVKNIHKFIIKPRFELFCGDDKVFLSPAKAGAVDGLIRYFDIEPELFDYLRENKMIRYSTEMAYLYNFPNKEGYDYEMLNGKPFKRSRKKETILSNAKMGKFN